jgi:hypothetical protein
LLLPKQHTHTRSFGWIAIKIYNEIKGLKVPTYDISLHLLIASSLLLVFSTQKR